MVVALALAAVFGSMSLANPAQAAIGQPADAELTERVDSPQVATPMNLKAVVATPAAVGNLALTWDNIATGKFYQSQRRIVVNGVGGDWTPWPTGATPALVADPMVAEGFTAGTTYDIRVREVESGTAEAPGSPSSNIIRVKVTATPNPPTVRTASIDEAMVRSIKIGWALGQPVLDGVITKWQYQAGPSANVGGWKDMGEGNPNLTEYTIPNLNSDTQYIVNIRAVSGYAASTTVNLVTTAITPEPAKPTGLEATPKDGMVTLKWDVTNDPGVYGYQYRYKEGEGAYGDEQNVGHGLTLVDTSASDAAAARAEARKAAAVVEVDVPGLKNGTEHTFQVRALSTDTIAVDASGFTVATENIEPSGAITSL